MARFAERERLFRRAGKVLVGVSGGPDSLACLLLLLELRARFGFEVVAAHFDHQLRPDSAADLDHVRASCARLGVECLSGEGEVAKAAAEQKTGVEDAARRMRYSFLAFIAGKEGAGCIATGHTRDDQVETVLLRIMRGTGVRGLQGMLPSSPVPGAPAQRLVRPLLCLSHAEAQAICLRAGLVALEDPSNANPAFARNRLRIETLPALRATNPSLDASLLGIAASAREAYAPIERQALSLQPRERGELGAIFDLARLRELQNEALIAVIEREGTFYSLEAQVNRTRVQNLRAVLASGSGMVRFGPVDVEVSCGAARVGPLLSPPPTFEPVLLNIPGVTKGGGTAIHTSTGPYPPNPGEWTGAFDTAATRGALRLRTLLPGDRLRTAAGLRSVHDFLVNAKVPRWERSCILAIADAEAVVLLVNGPPPPTPALAGETTLFVRAGALLSREAGRMPAG